MALFRRLRRDKEEPSGPPSSSPETETPPSPAAAPTLEPSPAASGPAVTESPAETPLPPAPPPLPEKAPVTVSEPLAFSHCFVCGSPLEGHACPTCRLEWVE
jgi:hypothetical protein